MCNRHLNSLCGKLIVGLLCALVLLLVTRPLWAAASGPTLQACGQYRALITRSAYRTFGPDAPVSTLVAQLHQESACKPDARSYAGAQGLAQFMPKTAEDMARKYPEECAPANPFSVRWAIGCRDRYMRSLLRAYANTEEAEQWAFGLSAYNGGGTWVTRDRDVCRHKDGCDVLKWWGNVELTPDHRRKPAAIKENRGYPFRILCQLTPRYVAEGWGRGITCNSKELP